MFDYTKRIENKKLSNREVVSEKTERITNENVLRKAGVKRSLLRKIRRRQLEFLGHIMRKEEL